VIAHDPHGLLDEFEIGGAGARAGDASAMIASTVSGMPG